MSALPGIDQLAAEVPSGTPLTQLAVAAELADRLRARGDQLLDQFVDAARASGSSWAEIGCTLGTSKQAAHERFAALGDPPVGQAPFGLSGTAATVLTSAGDEALQLGHHFIAPEHLVLGLLAQPDELAAQALAQLGVTTQAVRKHVRERLGTAAPRPTGSLGVSPQAKRLLELARAIAKSLGSRCPKTEHILLAATSPKLRSPAASVLADCGATPDKVRDQLTRMLLQEAPELAERPQNRSMLARVRMRSI
ncbi:MAG: Clp protease N-terminal domain-containing protein [Solirubrobacteraceae bacterium]